MICQQASTVEMRQGVGRSLEHVRASPARLVELLRSVLSVGDETTMAAHERLLGALDATQIQGSCARSDPRISGTWTACRACATIVRALGAGNCPGGSMMGAG